MLRRLALEHRAFAHLGRALAVVLVLADAPATLAAERVVAAGGGVTEIVYALGAQDRLVGVDSTSLYPGHARALPQIGYVRQLSAEGVLSLRPDMLLVADEAGPPAALEQIALAGARVVRVADGYSAEAVLRRVAGIAAALHVEPAGTEVAAAIRDDLVLVERAIAASGTRPGVLFLLSVGRGAPQASGRGTAADAMIRLAGGHNLVDSYVGYRPLSPEHVAALDPPVIMTTRDSVEQLGGLDAVLALPGIAATRAAAQRRIVALDALYLLGFGPRIAHALREAALGIDPTRAIPPLPPRRWAP
jgi:iron complex transport system substrate-binding protein